jgi:Domain of unknown function (DUF4376)
MYRVDDHYWIIGSDEAQVWSSKRAGYVPVDDVDYVTWLPGNGATHIATMQELEQVFAAQYPRGSLTTYTWYRRWRMEQGGITLTSGMPIKTDDRSQAKISGIYLAAQISPAVTTPFSAADGTVHQLTAEDIEAMNIELLTHINRAFSISADAIAQIDAGTITTIDQIDALFDAPVKSAQKNWLRKR